MTRLKILAAMALATVLIAGCETTKGAGRDIQKAGDAITDAAEDVQDAL